MRRRPPATTAPELAVRRLLGVIVLAIGLRYIWLTIA
jgi:hypothetical protein